MRSCKIVAALLSVLAVVAIYGAGQTYSVSPITTPEGWTDVRVHGLNNYGQVAGFGMDGGTFRPFIATTSNSMLIPVPPEWDFATAYGINDSGQVAGYGGGWIHSYIGTTAGISIIPEPEGWAFPFVSGINNLGQVVGLAPTGVSQVAFIGNVSGMSAIPLPFGCTSAEGRDINDAGQVAGHVNNFNGFSHQAFIGTIESCKLIPMPMGWRLSYGSGINNNGLVAGFGELDSPPNIYSRAFVGNESGTTPIPLIPGWTSMWTILGFPINDAGQVVGVGLCGGSRLGWIWDQGNGSRALNDLVPVEWTIQEAISINDRGQILALGSNQSGYIGPVLLEPNFCPVDIDIKPGSDPNSINLGSSGNVPVAIFSTAEFDATTIDPLTVTLAGASVRLKGKGTPMVASEDVNGDGLIDLIVHVDTSAFQLTYGNTEAVLEGQTYDGLKIRGKDTVRIIME